MTHLTNKQIVQFTDGTLDYASQAQCTGHLAICERCRKEIELQKTIAKIARHQLAAQPASSFVQRVMAQIIPQPQKSWKTRLVDNLGNVFAMAMVLAILGYAVSNPSLFQLQQQSSQPSIIPQVVTDTYVKLVQSISQRTNEVTQQVATSTGRENSNMISLTIVSLLILAAIDQFILKRLMGLRMKH
jgi:anti-sigma factor RsiW